ncbi:MAG: CcmD family protein [Coriobacteriia bacterium]|jgi:CcmD family protein|nr:CcmD family protein [Coriobacteriia bacterium]MDR2715001.1 CcmD family protein [Coriobacteriales bacterium]
MEPNAILDTIYSDVLAGAPYVIAAYALIWLVLFVYVVVVISRLKATEKRMALLEELVSKGND